MNVDATGEELANITEVLKLAALLDDRVAAPDKARIVAWAEKIHPHGFTLADMLDGLQAFYDQPRERSIGIGDLIDATRTIRRDRAMRQSSDPDTRDDAWADLGGNNTTRRDQYGHVDNAADEPDPREWTSEQRIAAYWEMVDAKHGRRPRTTRTRPEPPEPVTPQRTTPRLDAARAALRTCRGERECRPAISEYLAALTECAPRLLVGPYIPKGSK